jgi:hypothetical protein
MNTGDYITSGILQDFCLGLLTNEEEINVEAMCHAYPQVARELRLLRQALEKYMGSNKIVHREELRKAVWENVKKLWAEESS